MIGELWDTRKLAPQCRNTARPIAVPRTLSGSTSGSTTQTTGPQVAAKRR
jgi:hypothetical protein